MPMIARALKKQHSHAAFIHRGSVRIRRASGRKILACLAGFEPATFRLEGECSIQLSYRHSI